MSAAALRLAQLFIRAGHLIREDIARLLLLAGKGIAVLFLFPFTPFQLGGVAILVDRFAQLLLIFPMLARLIDFAFQLLTVAGELRLEFGGADAPGIRSMR